MYRVVVLAALIISAHANAACDGPQAFSIPPVNVPELPEYGGSAQDFVPETWRTLESVSGDFNRDGKSDIALAIAGDDPKNIINNECMLGPKEFDANPVAIVVMLRQEDGRYKLAAKDFDIIPRRNTPTMAQPFTGLKAKNNVLHVSYEHWQSAGTWEASTHNYLFRFEKDCMKLIGMEYRSVHRATGEERRISVNFNTGRYFISQSSPETKKAPKDWFTLKEHTLICLGQVPENLRSQQPSLSGEPEASTSNEQ